MVLPNLLHPIPITIQQLDLAATTIDPDIGEPIQSAARAATITVPAQIKWISKNILRMVLGGTIEDVDGYVVVRRVDVLAQGGREMRINDRITSIGTGAGAYAGEWYITRIEPFGHWQDQNGAALVKCWIKDRAPAKTR